jgi:hypothetical protein
MRNLGWLLVVIGELCVPSTVRSAQRTPADERAVLDQALVRSGLSSKHLPIVLTSVLPDTASPGADAWTVYEDGKGERIFVYTGGRTFLCASVTPRTQYQCMLRLASIIVHEAWHLKNGLDEAGAYNAQLAFLMFNGGSNFEILDIRRSRDRVLAEKRNVRKDARTSAGVQIPRSAVTYSRR